jgi:peptidoglycan-N-acetylglucosamine deacetylase
VGIRRNRWLAVIVTAGLLLAAGHGLHRLARSRTWQVVGKVVARVETGERVVALTFDDGPTAAVADEVLGVLASRRVHATFFVTGADVAAAPVVARRLVAAGHELGNHTYSHERMIFRSQAFYRSEVERTDELIRETGERREIYFRMPYCWRLVGLPWYLWRTGRTTVTWDIDPVLPAGSRPRVERDARLQDPAPDPRTSPETIVARTLERVRPGSIVLLHPWYGSGPEVRAALPRLIDGLHGRGYRFVTVDELVHLRAGADPRSGATAPDQGHELARPRPPEAGQP